MEKTIPYWALRVAGAGDRRDAIRAQVRGVLFTNWDPLHGSSTVNYAGQPLIDGPPVDWAEGHDWPTPRTSFEQAFLVKMLESDKNFDLAVAESGVELYLPQKMHTLTAEDLQGLDELYQAAENWGSLVEGLRDLRRAIESGVIVLVEDEELRTVGAFYQWAHGRYHALEDGYDGWIGIDEDW